MRSAQGTRWYWKLLNDILDMVKQLGMLTYFFTLSCAELRWEELTYINNRLNSVGLNVGLVGLEKISYQEQCNMLINNPVTVDRPSIKLKYFSKKLPMMIH